MCKQKQNNTHIHSVIPQDHNGPTTTIIWAKKDEAHAAIPYHYNHTHGLLHDPDDTYMWLHWDGGTLNEAILFVIAL